MKRRLLLLGVMVICFCVLAAADMQSDRVEDKTFPEKDGILQLKKGNFNRALRKYKQLLVHFCKLQTESQTTGLQAAWFSRFKRMKSSG